MTDLRSRFDPARQMAYRVRILPVQLDRARRKVRALETEAARLGMTDLLEVRP